MASTQQQELTHAEATVELGGIPTTVVAVAKTFSTGSRGFMGNGRIQLPDGRKFTVQVQMVEIGSKPASPANGKGKR